MSDSTSAGPPAELSIEEFEGLPESDEYRSELVRGRVVREPRPGPYHGGAQARLSYQLIKFVEVAGYPGVVFSDVGVVISRRLRTVRGPDVAVYRAERLPHPWPRRGFLEVIPDLAIEIVSPGNTVSEIVEKVMEFLDAGARLVWVVDPAGRTATIYRSRRDIRIVPEDGDLDGEDVLPGFRVPLSEILR